jgi:hypothetical protein
LYEFGVAHGSHMWVRLDEYLEVLDLKLIVESHTGYSDSIYQLASWPPRDFDEGTILLTCHGELDGGGESYREESWKLTHYSEAIL